MREPTTRSNASRDGSTVPRNTLQRNAYGVIGNEEAAPSSRDGWRHPASLAALITAAASLITALTPLLLKLP